MLYESGPCEMGLGTAFLIMNRASKGGWVGAGGGQACLYNKLNLTYSL